MAPLAPPAAPAPLPCSAHCHSGTVPTYTRSASFGFDDGLGPTVDGPCEHCNATGFEPCGICHDAPATSTVASRHVCDDCAPFVRRSVAETIPAPDCEVAS